MNVSPLICLETKQSGVQCFVECRVINMSTVKLKEYFDFIKDIIYETGHIVVQGFQCDKDVETKGNVRYDLVTVYDKKVENVFVQKINEKYPDHQIIGEETWPPGKKLELTNSPTWIIDPIDGTINYIKRIPIIGISVALAVEKEVVLGVVYNPITNHFYSAIKGEGSYCNGRKLHVTTNEDLRKAVIGNELSLASIPFLYDRTIERFKKLSEFGVIGIRSLGSAAIALCYVAEGSLDVYFTDGLKCWDIAAGVLILQEAGGCAGSPDGKPFDLFGRVLLTAGNKTLLESMVSILKECDERTIDKVHSLMPASLKSVIQE